MLRCFTSNGWASRRGWKNTCLSQHWLIAQVRISLLSVLMQSSQFFPFPGLFFPSYPQGSIQAQQSLPYLVFCWAKHKFSYLFSIIQTFKIFAMTRLWSPELPCQKSHYPEATHTTEATGRHLSWQSQSSKAISAKAPGLRVTLDCPD